jgi:hypothetical protein
MERAWKIVERGGLFIGTVCAVITTLYTIGLPFALINSMASSRVSLGPLPSAAWQIAQGSPCLNSR